ncbi:acyl-CoA dehydrogenase family protein [Ralstonia solanacearum]|uniref:Acyl-CoA dehydrogenase family protein n=1 Tax=Ralstonia solanacearum TaxID=305 RepID=A0AAE3NGL4_RALSL|nr:acyl-CoA dehydrogenase family protein [Ralstonia solanacearum]MBB6584190.1 acyl-CoA dehydrogenase family protein [Ralstonia solanacearum]MDB0520056.1 acyl-CoA dehydrogenase family protein [Ralstonia solanacearum]
MQHPQQHHDVFTAWLADGIRRFTDEAIIPSEPVLARGDVAASQRMRELQQQARAAGLWGVFFPAALGGRIASAADYLPVAEQEGRSEYGPAIFGSRAALDVHMLHRHGSTAVRERFLAPLAAGEITGAYAVSEPDGVGSVPSTIGTSATRVGDTWIVSGRKWFISRAKGAAFVTVVARTEADTASAHPFSMIVVPTETAGFSVGQEAEILGRPQGQCELSFDRVAVPQSCVLSQAGQGLDLMRERLSLGRTLNAMHWLGLAQRCFDMMCGRICSPRGTLARLPDKQLVRQHVFNVRQAIVGARALVRLAAGSLEAPAGNEVDINMAKVAASRALSLAVDSATQIFGAEGLGDGTPLSSIYRTARTTRILDGADEVLINAVGRRILQEYAEAVR